LVFGADAASAEILSKAYVNGEITPVSFNDGDSFRIMNGPFKGTQSRLSGYNTLESFGPVHSWGRWTEKEMYVLAKEATNVGRRGVWNCEGDGKKDGYGRLLLFCKDLATELIKRGLAHAYSINDEPADADLLKAQEDAIINRRGFWAHGVPAYIVTSLHVKSEGGDKNGETSNRMISTVDGHTQKWVHNDEYAECQKACRMRPSMAPEVKARVIEALRAAPETTGFVSRLAPIQMDQLLDVYAMDARVYHGDATERAAVEAQLKLLAEQEVLVLGPVVPDSCMVHVDFRRRFGGDRAVCLR
jgi:endonuclease YncB( thermonuclease family)